MGSDAALPVGADAVRSVLRRLVSGVTVLTTLEDGRPWGMTVSAFTPVSLDPPLVLVCVNRATATARHIVDQRRIGINVLSAGQSEICGRCAAPGTPKFLEHDDLAEPPSAWATPRLDGALACFDTVVESVHEAGTHLVVITRIVQIDTATSGGPLLYGDGRYLELANHTTHEGAST
jgi:flavin reductase (DIM6/NTAB) family NADH-FMN oxidoreductase RutF